MNGGSPHKGLSGWGAFFFPKQKYMFFDQAGIVGRSFLIRNLLLSGTFSVLCKLVMKKKKLQGGTEFIYLTS